MSWSWRGQKEWGEGMKALYILLKQSDENSAQQSLKQQNCNEAPLTLLALTSRNFTYVLYYCHNFWGEVCKICSFTDCYFQRCLRTVLLLWNLTQIAQTGKHFILPSCSFTLHEFKWKSKSLFLKKKSIETILLPYQQQCSKVFRKSAVPLVVPFTNHQNRLEIKRCRAILKR